MKSNFITDFIDKDISINRFNREIHTRFPPEPNGFLHIGHAKAIYISFEIAKKYKGKCNLRYDDTNPRKEEEVFVKSIEHDLKWLGYEPYKICFASDYFQQFYDFALVLIEKNLAYVDDSSYEEIKEMRGTLKEPGVNSPYRERSPEKNKNLFREMKEGLYDDGEKVLRAKIDMGSPNLNMRDPIIYRISKLPHHRTKNQWNIYPMYDFAHPLEDAIENITHSLCTLEFEDHRPLYDWVLKNVGIKFPPRQIEFARLNISNTVLSKRQLIKLLSERKVESWEDPRMPTISGLRRKGYTEDAIKKFIEEAGISKSNSVTDIAMLEHFVREDLKEKTENRNVCFDPIKIRITNYPKNKTEELLIENNKLNENLGKRKVSFSNELYIDGDDFIEEPPKKFFRLFPGNEVRLAGA
ncbi:MAG: glutamine--tRNA ligase, partial [Clostridiales Family XIII bacterium]|nr:glutamine--tRNA ligase [Clostridiales Family XIII bacterium]